MSAGRFPYFTVLLRSQWREPGGWWIFWLFCLAALLAPCYTPFGPEESLATLVGVWFVGEGLGLLFATMATGEVVGNEYKSDRLRQVGTSSFSPLQVILGLIFAPGLRWLLFAAVQGVAASLLLSTAAGDFWQTCLIAGLIQAGLFLLFTCVGLIVVNWHLPRAPSTLTGRDAIVTIAQLTLGVFAVVLFVNANDRLPPDMFWVLPLAGLAALVWSWSRTAGFLTREPPWRWWRGPALLTPALFVAAVGLLAPATLPMCPAAVLLLALALGVEPLWQVDEPQHWAPTTRKAGGWASLAYLSGALAGGVLGWLTPHQGLETVDLLGLYLLAVLAGLGRLWCYIGVLGWARQHHFRAQSLALAAAILAVEVCVPVLAFVVLDLGAVQRLVVETSSGIAHWERLEKTLRVAFSFEPGLEQPVNLLHDWVWLAATGIITVVGLGGAWLAWRCRLAAGETVPVVRRVGRPRLADRLAPLLAALARGSVRGGGWSGFWAGLLVLGLIYLGLWYFAADGTWLAELAPLEPLSSSYAWLCGFQALLLAGLFGLVGECLSTDREACRLDANLNSALSLPQLLGGYLLGPPLLVVVLLVLIGVGLVWIAGEVGERLPGLVYHQAGMLLLFLLVCGMFPTICQMSSERKPRFLAECVGPLLALLVLGHTVAGLGRLQASPPEAVLGFVPASIRELGQLVPWRALPFTTLAADLDWNAAARMLYLAFFTGVVVLTALAIRYKERVRRPTPPLALLLPPVLASFLALAWPGAPTTLFGIDRFLLAAVGAGAGTLLSLLVWVVVRSNTRSLRGFSP